MVRRAMISICSEGDGSAGVDTSEAISYPTRPVTAPGRSAKACERL